MGPSNYSPTRLSVRRPLPFVVYRLAAEEFRQTKIQNHRLTLRGYKDIRRLDVPMDDPLSVSGFQSTRNLNGKIEQFVC